jgi:Type IIA topoisomerase (DNA gyrase/topo II, topoisomerase IV), B subunit
MTFGAGVHIETYCPPNNISQHQKRTCILEPTLVCRFVEDQWTAAPGIPPAASCTSYRATRHIGAVKSGRDSEYGAINDPIRGMILICLNANYARLFQSDVIVYRIKSDGMRCGAGRETIYGAGYL